MGRRLPLQTFGEYPSPPPRGARLTKSTLFRLSRLSVFQSSLLLIHFLYDPNSCSYCTKVWHRTCPAKTSQTTTLHVHHVFLYISLPSLHDYNVKLPIFTFCRGREQKTTDNFLFLFRNFDGVL